MSSYVERTLAAFEHLEEENAKLREELEAAKHDLQVFSMGAVKLDAENDKLRTQLDDVTASLGRVEERNAKLRELVRDLYEFAMDEYPDGAELNFANRMRELGVEL